LEKYINGGKKIKNIKLGLQGKLDGIKKNQSDFEIKLIIYNL